MPFLPDGASTDSTIFAQIGYALPAAHLIVDQDKLLALKRGFEDERDRVRDWLDNNSNRLRAVPPPGSDPCSECTVVALGENGQAAIEAADGYVRRLSRVAKALGETARAYGLMEEENYSKYKAVPG